jgi:hypothetical protein
MKKSRLLGAVLSGALAAAPAMAEHSGTDFHALGHLPTGLTSMPEDQLASIEGGEDMCMSSAGNSDVLGIPIIPVNALNCSDVAVPIQVNGGILNSGAQPNSLREIRQNVR